MTLVPTSREATAIRDDVAFFDAVRQSIAKIEAIRTFLRQGPAEKSAFEVTRRALLALVDQATPA